MSNADDTQREIDRYMAEFGYGHLGSLIKLWMMTLPAEPKVPAVADALGRTRNTLYKWMKGESAPGPEDLRNLSALTGISQRTLLEAIWLDKGYDIDNLVSDRAAE